MCRARTLAGCQLRPIGPQALLVCREPGREILPAEPGGSGVWDGRFRLEFGPDTGGLSVRRLGIDGWRRIVSLRPELRASAIPYPARLSLPALWSDCEPVAVPHLGFGTDQLLLRVCFEPRQPLVGAGFMLA